MRSWQENSWSEGRFEEGEEMKAESSGQLLGARFATSEDLTLLCELDRRQCPLRASHNGQELLPGLIQPKERRPHLPLYGDDLFLQLLNQIPLLLMLPRSFEKAGELGVGRDQLGVDVRDRGGR